MHAVLRKLQQVGKNNCLKLEGVSPSPSSSSPAPHVFFSSCSFLSFPPPQRVFLLPRNEGSAKTSLLPRSSQALWDCLRTICSRWSEEWQTVGSFGSRWKPVGCLLVVNGGASWWSAWVFFGVVCSCWRLCWLVFLLTVNVYSLHKAFYGCAIRWSPGSQSNQKNTWDKGQRPRLAKRKSMQKSTATIPHCPCWTPIWC